MSFHWLAETSPLFLEEKHFHFENTHKKLKPDKYLTLYRILDNRQGNIFIFFLIYFSFFSYMYHLVRNTSNIMFMRVRVIEYASFCHLLLDFGTAQTVWYILFFIQWLTDSHTIGASDYRSDPVITGYYVSGSLTNLPSDNRDVGLQVGPRHYRVLCIEQSDIRGVGLHWGRTRQYWVLCIG